MNKAKAKERCESWFRMLSKKLGLGFHPDTKFEDYINLETKEHTYTDKEAKLLNERMKRVFEEVKDPYAIGIKVWKELGLIDKTSKKGKISMTKARKTAKKKKAVKTAAPKTKAKKKAAKKTKAATPSIRATMMDLMRTKGIDNVTYEETEKIAKKLKKDTKWKKTHFYFYRKIARIELANAPKTKKKAKKKAKKS